MTESNSIFQDPMTISAILGAVIKKVGYVTLSQEDFVFENNEEDLLLVYNEDGTITIAIGVHSEDA